MWAFPRWDGEGTSGSLTSITRDRLFLTRVAFPGETLGWFHNHHQGPGTPPGSPQASRGTKRGAWI